MEILDFRTLMLQKIRAFDSWAWKDARENPQDYEDMQFWDWFNMFKTFVENEQ